jgi:major type 1 subunit fimbrin (pilin)
LNKIINRVVLAAFGVAVASSAFAQSTQTNVNFTGELTGNTCSIATGSLDQTVTLPTISTTTLAAAGDVAGSTPFNLQVINCSPGVSQVAAHFEMMNMDPVAINGIYSLQNTATGAAAATHVDVQLVDANGSPVSLGRNGAFFNVAGDGTANLVYGGQYIATGKTTPGTVESVASLTLAYQ